MILLGLIDLIFQMLQICFHLLIVNMIIASANTGSALVRVDHNVVVVEDRQSWTRSVDHIVSRSFSRGGYIYGIMCVKDKELCQEVGHNLC